MDDRVVTHFLKKLKVRYFKALHGTHYQRKCFIRATLRTFIP